MTRKFARLVVPASCALVLGACGGGSEPTASPPPQSGGAPDSRDCGRVEVPGHEAVDVRASGVGCAAADGLVSAAVGKGRAAYESQGFRCDPADAGGGDTNYRCAMGSATVTFRYGAR